MTKPIIIGQRNDELERGGLKILYKFQVAAFKTKIIEVCNFQLKAGPFKRRQTFRKIKQRNFSMIWSKAGEMRKFNESSTI